MRIEYLETEKIIRIEDELKNQYFLLKFLMICNIFQANLWFINPEKGFINGIWIGLGSISLAMLCYLLFKKSSAVRIAVDQIESLERRTRFGRIRYFLKLKNGKERDLLGIKNPSELRKLWEVMSTVGVKGA